MSKYKVHNWGELHELKDISETHTLEICFEYGNCKIRPKDNKLRVKYLSTHTFYNERNRRNKSSVLQACGFDIELC